MFFLNPFYRNGMNLLDTPKIRKGREYGTDA